MKTAVKQLTFRLAGGAPEYIDLAECLSIVNRRAFKQGYVYAVEAFSFYGASKNCQVLSLPTSWTVYNSWQKARSLWERMNRLASAGIPSRDYPVYHDFKVFFDAVHYVGHTTISSNLLPRDGGAVLFSNVGREWDYSQYVTATAGGAAPATEHAAHMLGDDSAVANVGLATDGSNAIIQMYGDTRATIGAAEPEVPADASDSWASELFDDGETLNEILQHLEGANDRPPYAHALDPQGGDDPIYVGGSASGVNGHDLLQLAPIGAETVFAPGAEIPLGLLKVSGSENGILTIYLAPGDYNGVAAMRMEQVQT